MCLAVNPLADPVVALGNLIDRPSITFGALVPLATFQAIDHVMNAGGIIIVDLVFVDLVTQPCLQCVGPRA